MSSSVLNIMHDIELNVLRHHLSNKSIKYIHINHNGVGEADKNIIELSRKHKHIRTILVEITNHGFMTYVLRGGVSSLVHLSSIKYLWNPVKEKEYTIDINDIVYQYEDAEQQFDKKLVVMFYPMAPNPNISSLSRYFPNNFPTLKKHLGKNVAILRVADIGAITGAFYLNTIALPKNEFNIQSLIFKIMEDRGIDKNNVIFYGTSKGGSGALYHGLLGGFPVVSVDPIVNDEHYILNHGDLHLVNGVFEKEKKDVFYSIRDGVNKENIPPITIITSHNSEQYSYIMNFINPLKNKATIYNNINPMIRTHTEVAPNSIHIILNAINSFCLMTPSAPGERNVM
ncbi:XcbB/CpsF family capsular polysaccharide biosynthesis protein [Aeromonas sp. R4-3]|uniref:XcbB/CpsF family capsular polysaccharide biosynthesis protein n=1 Tax=Aeromonas sp. R4-3 TaxID=3138466 RepID=UPI0034A1EF7E